MERESGHKRTKSTPEDLERIKSRVIEVEGFENWYSPDKYSFVFQHTKPVYGNLLNSKVMDDLHSMVDKDADPDWKIKGDWSKAMHKDVMGSIAKLVNEKDKLFAEVEVYRDEVETLKKTNDELRKRIRELENRRPGAKRGIKQRRTQAMGNEYAKEYKTKRRPLEDITPNTQVPSLPFRVRERNTKGVSFGDAELADRRFGRPPIPPNSFKLYFRGFGAQESAFDPPSRAFGPSIDWYPGSRSPEQKGYFGGDQGQNDPVSRLLGTGDRPPERDRKVKEFNEYCNKHIDELHKALTRTTEHLVNKRKELFGEDHLGKVRIHDVVCYVLHPDGPSAIFKTSAFHNELVNERMDQIHNFLCSWQEVYTTMVFEGEERFSGPMSHPVQVSDHEALAKLLRDQRMKLEEEEMQKLKSDQSIQTAVGLFVTAGREKDESVSFQDRIRRLGVVFGLSPADIEGEAKRTWKYGVTESLYKVAAQKSVGLDYHKTMAECPLYNEAAAGQEDKCEKCKHARILLEWPGRLMREYTNPKNGRTAYEAKYIPFIAPSKLSVVASQMLVKHFKVALPSVWAECKGLDPDAHPPADTNNTSIPVDVEAATNGVEGDVYDSFCRPRMAVVDGGQSSQGGAAAATDPGGTPPVGDRLENILEELSNPPPLGNDGPHDGEGGEGRSPSGGEQPEEEDSEDGSPRDAGQVLAGILERRRRPTRNAKRPFEEDYVFE
ncbi:hypothetical protein M9434_007207 [Picochlorum sp. BPE23]|nr:hypothetical protein M9434_007207 [Picochlorum sp. BPE23]